MESSRMKRKNGIGNLMTFNISGLTIIPFIFDIVKTDFKEMRLKRVPKYVFLDV